MSAVGEILPLVLGKVLPLFQILVWMNIFQILHLIYSFVQELNFTHYSEQFQIERNYERRIKKCNTTNTMADCHLFTRPLHIRVTLISTIETLDIWTYICWTSSTLRALWCLPILLLVLLISDILRRIFKVWKGSFFLLSLKMKFCWQNKCQKSNSIHFLYLCLGWIVLCLTIVRLTRAVFR